MLAHGSRRERLAITRIWTGSNILISTIGPQPAWMADGLCAQVDPEIFFPEKGGSTREAKTICRVCPVRTDCLGWALERREPFGVLGGLSGRERRKLLRGRAA